MNKGLFSRVSLIAGIVIGLASTGIATVSWATMPPAFVVTHGAPNWAVTIDCTVPTNGSIDIPFTPTSSVTVTTQNCGTSVWALAVDDTITATYPGGFTDTSSTIHYTSPINNLDTGHSYATYTLDPNTSFSFLDIASAHNYAIRFNVGMAVETTTPQPTYVGTETIPIPSNPSAFTIPNVPKPDMPNLMDSPDCGLWSGEHPYGTSDVTITEDGAYTFRVVDTDPISSPGFSAAENGPLLLNGIALYSTFNDQAPNDSILGCNVAAALLPISLDDTSTTTGFPISRYYSEFTVNLHPGTYRLVGFTLESISADDWAAGIPFFGSPIATSLTYEVWRGDATWPQANLPSTGRDSGLDVMLGAATIVMIALGGLLVAVRRRTRR